MAKKTELNEVRARVLADYMYSMIMDDGSYSQDEAEIAVKSLTDLYCQNGHYEAIELAHEYFDDMIGR